MTKSVNILTIILLQSLFYIGTNNQKIYKCNKENSHITELPCSSRLECFSKAMIDLSHNDVFIELLNNTFLIFDRDIRTNFTIPHSITGSSTQTMAIFDTFSLYMCKLESARHVSLSKKILDIEKINLLDNYFVITTHPGQNMRTLALVVNLTLLVILCYNIIVMFKMLK